MDRTAVGTSSEPAGADDDPLPQRRPGATRLEATGEQPVAWFGAGAPGSPGTAPSDPAAAPAAGDTVLTGTRPAPAGTRPAPAEARPAAAQAGAAPAGPGRASFGFGDGPISGQQVAAARGRTDVGGLPLRGPGRTGRAAGAAPGAFPDPAAGTPAEAAPQPVPATPASSPRAGSPAVAAPRSLDESAPGSFAGPATGDLPIVRQPASPAAEATWSAPSGTARQPAPAPWEPIAFEPANRPSSVDATEAPGGFFTPDPVVWGDPATAPAGSPPVERRRQSRVVTLGMALLGAVAVAAIALTGVVYYTGPDTELPQMLQLGGNSQDQRVASAPLENRTIASFELLAATDRVRLRIADLDTDLYRISAAEGAGIRPSAQLKDDLLRLDLSRQDSSTGGEIEVLLSAKVRWTLRFAGYAAERIVDLSQGRVSRIEMVGGTRRAEVTLAKATGTIPVKITGGVEELVLRAPATSPVRVKVGGGAATVTAGSRTLRDVPAGSTLTPKDWQNADRYDVDAASPITLLTVGSTG